MRAAMRRCRPTLLPVTGSRAAGCLASRRGTLLARPGTPFPHAGLPCFACPGWESAWNGVPPAALRPPQRRPVRAAKHAAGGGHCAQGAFVAGRPLE